VKKIFRARLLPLFTLGAGGLGLALRLWLLSSGVDEKGLLVAGHPANALSFILTALALLVFALCSLDPNPQMGKTVFHTPAAAMIGCCAAAAGILATTIEELLRRAEYVTVVCCVLGVLAAAALVFSGVLRLRRLQPAWWMQLPVVLFFMFHMISQYRFWSAEPEVQSFFFSLLASLFLMLSAYHRIATVAGTPQPKRYLFTSQAALFFCCMSCVGSSHLFYLTCGAWLLTQTLPRRMES